MNVLVFDDVTDPPIACLVESFRFPKGNRMVYYLFIFIFIIFYSGFVFLFSLACVTEIPQDSGEK